ncbi:hypothetical protein HB775_08590 [Rhizobium leguminosarum bv. trifolii]|nr:hypothetical protein HB775_08590 [Rhizobium leguminosarum bv. trifolii]
MVETSRLISFPVLTFPVLTFTVLAAGALLLEHTGFFAGAFRTEIPARVDAGDVVSASEAVTAWNVDASDKSSAR